MKVEEFLKALDDVLAREQMAVQPGEEFTSPPLDVLRYYARPVRLSRWPIVGRGMSVAAVVQQPNDTPQLGGQAILMQRIAAAVHGRFPPWPRGHGLSLALSAIVCTTEPIRPDDDDGQRLRALGPAGSTRSRVVPLALFRVNLGQEAMTMAMAGGPGDLFPELDPLTEYLTGRFQRFLPLLGPF